MSTARRGRRWRLLAGLLGALVIFGAAASAEAQRGGRFGGRGGFSAPGYSGDGRFSGRGFTAPRNGYRGYGYYGPTFGPRWGFFGGPVVVWGVPLSFATAGTLMLLFIVMVIVGIVAWRRRATAPPYAEIYGDTYIYPDDVVSERPIQVMKVQLALLATARHVRDKLEQLARFGRTDTPEGLAELLNETAITLVREQAYWRAGFVGQEVFEHPFRAEQRFEEAVSRERAKLESEAISNQGGRLVEGGAPPPEPRDKVGRYIVVTLLAAAAGPLLEDAHHPSEDDMRDALVRLASIPASQLKAIEVIWVPADPQGALDENDLLVKYPALSTF